MTYRIREPLQISNEDGTDVFTLNSEDIPDGYGFVRVGNSIVGHEIVPSGGMTGQTLTRNGVLSWTGPSIDNFSNTITKLYVSTSGSDGYGDGSIGNPFATPQAAINAIPFSITKGSIVKIYCGAGRFPYPDCSRLPTTIRVQVYGDVSTPVVEVAMSPAVVFTLVASKGAQMTGNVGAWAGAVTTGSHWVLQDNEGLWDDLYADYANIVLASTSPNLVVAADVQPNAYSPFKLFAYATVFYTSEAPARLMYSSYTGPTAQSPYDSDGLFITGIEIEAPNDAFNVEFEKTFFFGCKFSTVSAGTTSWQFQECTVSAYFTPSTNFCTLRKDAVLAHSAVLGGSINTYDNSEIRSGTTFLTGASVNVLGKTSVSASGIVGSGVDFEGTGPYCFTVSTGGSLSLNATLRIGTQRTTFLTNAGVNAYIQRGSYTVTGAVTGSAVTIANGSQYIGVKAQCNGTLTAAVSEIIVGGNAGNTFASLPATDVAAASPQFCRAT